MILIKLLFVAWFIVSMLLLSWIAQYLYDEYFKNK